MSDDELILGVSKVIDSARESIDEPNWAPLELVLPFEQCGGFMYMGTGQSNIDSTVYLYKHGITRHYLNLDATGNAYIYNAALNTYRYLPNKAGAIERAFEGLEELHGTRETDYDDDYVAERNTALRKAGWTVIG